MLIYLKSTEKQVLITYIDYFLTEEATSTILMPSNEQMVLLLYVFGMMWSARIEHFESNGLPTTCKTSK